MTSRITPKSELVQQWMKGCPGETALRLAAQAAQWGWDQRSAATEAELQKARDEELEACVNLLYENRNGQLALVLKNTRRPKPPSLKDLALNDLEQLLDIAKLNGVFNPPDTIRRALEALPND